MLTEDVFTAVNERMALSFKSASRHFVGRKLHNVDLVTWAQQCVPHYFDKPSSIQHRWFGAKLITMAGERGTRLSVEGPRGSAKSTWATTVYPLYAVCEELEKYIILAADTTDQARRYLESIARELETNEYIERRYPEAFGHGPTWNKGCIVTRNGVRIEAVGAGKKIRGRRDLQHRPSLVIVDDPEGDDAAFSKIKRRRIQDWFTKAILSLGDAKTNYVVVGTRIHSECLTAVLAQRPGWQSRVFKAIMEWPQRMDLWGEWELMLGDSMVADADRLEKARAFYDEHKADMDLGAKVLWPESEDLYALMLKRAQDGHVAFESEKQNNPIDPSRSEWGETFFSSPDIWFEDWPDDLDVKVSALDPSKGKEDDSADFQAMVDVGIRLSQGKIEIFIDSDLSKRHVSSMCEEFIARINCFNPDAAVIEQNQFQELLLDDLEAEAARQGCLAAIGGITNTQRKILRIRRLGTFINRGCLKFKRRSRGNAELIKQLAQFPNADHDDGPDVLEMAIRKARELISDDAEVSNPF